MRCSLGESVAALIRAFPAVIRVNYTIDMHFVLLIEKVKYNLLLGAPRDEKRIQIWAVEKSDGSYLDKAVLSGR